MFTDILIRLLFRLLGHSMNRLYDVDYLFGVSTANFQKRKNTWKKSLVRLYKDKAMLDFLYYQAENDKETVFKNKIRPDIARGARVRTLFIVYSAHKAYEEMVLDRRARPDEKQDQKNIIKAVGNSYTKLTDVDGKH